MYVLRARHEDSFIVRFGNGVLAFLEASKANFPCLSVRLVRVSNEGFKTVIKKGTERRDSSREQFEGFEFICGQIFEGVG